LERIAHIRLMATYNQWMNAKLYDAAAALPRAELMADKGAFFKSVFGTLSHIAVGDHIWLHRFATHPAGYAALEPVRQLPKPSALDLLQFAELRELAERRQLLDAAILGWVDELAPKDLDHVLHYVNSRGEVGDKDFFGVIMHFFNHQTHHRGQASTLLSQAGIDIGVTDLLVLLPNTPAA
jgi:uncharacterized damage-inducible protein DinB